MSYSATQYILSLSKAQEKLQHITKTQKTKLKVYLCPVVNQKLPKSSSIKSLSQLSVVDSVSNACHLDGSLQSAPRQC